MDLEGKNYCGITIEWNYDKEYVKIYMPTYTPEYLKYFIHRYPQNPCYATHKWTVPEYGQSTQYVKGPENTPHNYDKSTKYIQAKVG